MQSVCIRQSTVDTANMSITYACWYGHKHPDPSGKLLKHGQKSKVYQNRIVGQNLLEYIEDSGNDQLAAFRGDLKSLKRH